MITISNNPATDQPADTRRIRQEIAIVLVVTFGLSGMRAALRLLSDLMQPVPLNQQQTTLAEHQSDTSWIDLAMQLCSSAMLFSWGFLALYLLRESIFSRWRPKAILEGAGLAALIGNVHAAAQTEDARVLELFELAFLVWLDWLKRHGVVKLRHRMLIELTIAQMQFAGEGHHMHPALRPGRLVVLLGIAEPGDHHSFVVGRILSR
ncbi:MAG: hypothetical protein ACFNLH_04230 [Corynebacterium matruchotii]